jgi:hypothetical protein
VIGTIPGRNPRRMVVVGAHYDTKDLPGFVVANDGASGTAVVRQLARTIKPRQVRPTLVVVFFDGEEAPRGVPDSQFERYGLRGSKVAAPTLRHAEAAIVLDFVGDKQLAIPRDGYSNRRLWRQLRAAATRTGFGRHFLAREHPEGARAVTRRRYGAGRCQSSTVVSSVSRGVRSPTPRSRSKVLAASRSLVAALSGTGTVTTSGGVPSPSAA